MVEVGEGEAIGMGKWQDTVVRDVVPIALPFQDDEARRVHEGWL
jgi:hypothetical protein